MIPWKNDRESKTIEDVLDYRKLNYIYEKLNSLPTLDSL